MTFLIRPVEQSDAESWERLRNLLWEGDDHKAEIARFFNGEAEEPNEVLVAVTSKNDVIAHIELSLRYDIDGLAGIKTGYIEGLFVEERYRLSDVVPRLLRAAELWAKDQGCLAFASDRDDRVIIHTRYIAAPPNNSFKPNPLRGSA
nr:aminoglycoside 6'-N-acetyltransferase AacA34 [uncultured bacterium]BDD36829.1 aminoglycoside 6'-N-acetyltransferase AacA34 [uncultured bacterium]BDD36921.1 aminoglycoside 6'-N-acetyltransferase AacA34 [uncultured bacterium]BDD37013.1 aminoglycoside 6'-N-acetyltransferase AacA34 [uncultured bacterium]